MSRSLPEQEAVEATPDGADLAEEAPAGPQPLYLHVGVPKSGSTFLQTVMGTHRAVLREHGYTYPYVRQEGMFHAAVEMAGTPERWGLDQADIEGTFAHLLRRGRRLGGSVVISHEIFGGATRKQIRAVGEALDGFEPHLVVTTRDLGRTITAEWQERVKNGRTASFADFADKLISDLPAAGDGPGTTVGFWRSQNLEGLLDRWGTLVPAERIHVVVCPVKGAPPHVLWSRFAEAIGVSPDVVDLSEIPQRNESLGAGQVALLRRVNDALGGRLEQPWFSMIAKRWFAQTLLSTAGTRKPVTPAPVAQRLTEVARTWIGLIERGGYPVHGDLAELLPQVVDAGSPHPDDVTDAEILEGLPEVLAEMLLRQRDVRLALEDSTGTARELEAERDRLEAELAALAETASRRRRWRPS